MTKNGNGVQTLSGAGITYTGNTTVTGGTLQFVDAVGFSMGSAPAPNTIAIGANGVIEFNVSTNTGWTNDGGNEALGTDQGTTITGNGVFLKTGPGVLSLDEQGGGHPVYFAMTGGIIDIEGGTLKNGGWQGGIWDNNLASMTIASGATFDLWDGNPVTIDALNGAGTITSFWGQNVGSHDRRQQRLRPV